MPTDTILTRIRETLGMNMRDFAKEWRELSDKDKEELRRGVRDGSMTY